MKVYIVLSLLLTGITFSQGLEIPASFDHLNRIVVDEDWNILAFVPKGSITDLPDIKLLENDEYEELVIPVAIVDLEGNENKDFLLVFSPGPSADPTFEFYKISEKDTNFLFSLACKQIIINDNGYMFTSGHANNMFNTRRIFKFERDSLREVKQPFDYVGLKTKTLKRITIYEDKEFTNVLAVVPEDSPIEVLFGEWNEEEFSWKFLIKSSIGFLGWWKLDDNYRSEEIEGLFFAGD